MTTRTATATATATSTAPDRPRPSASASGRSTAAPAVRAAVFSSASDDWPTPQAFFDARHAEFGFVVDACASSTNRKAGVYYGLDHADPDRRDGLAGDWAADAARLGGAIWLNPPYGRAMGAWMAKAAAAAAAGATVVALVPARTDTAWFHDHVLACGAEVRHVRGRLKFGEATSSAPFASLVVVFRPANRTATAESVQVVAARPQRQVQHVLQKGERHQVRPAVPSQQRLRRRAGQPSVATHPGQAAPVQRSAQVPGDRAGVARSARRSDGELAVGEATPEVLRRSAQPGRTANHGPHATAAARPRPGGRPGGLQHPQHKLSDQSGMLPAVRTSVRGAGSLPLPRHSAGKEGVR
jgi:phage N-6-adenine-methyltransferase